MIEFLLHPIGFYAVVIPMLVSLVAIGIGIAHWD